MHLSLRFSIYAFSFFIVFNSVVHCSTTTPHPPESAEKMYHIQWLVLRPFLISCKHGHSCPPGPVQKRSNPSKFPSSRKYLFQLAAVLKRIADLFAKLQVGVVEGVKGDGAKLFGIDLSGLVQNPLVRASNRFSRLLCPRLNEYTLTLLSISFFKSAASSLMPPAKCITIKITIS